MKLLNFAKLTSLAILTASTCTLVNAQSQPSQPSEPVVLFASKAYTSSSTQIDHFDDNINLKPGQENLPLTLVVGNGLEGRKPFSWFRLNIAGYLMATEQNMQGKREAAIDVTGRMQPGGGQVLIEAAGYPGAMMNFWLTTPPVKLTSVTPNEVTAGQTVVLRGVNFSSDEKQNTVLFNGRPARVLSASVNAITAVVPPGTQPGANKVMVSVDSIDSQTVDVAVANVPSPILLGTNYWMAPPGAYLTIRGKNFDPNASGNQVYFGNVQGSVVGGDASSLEVIVPNWSYGPSQIGIPLRVVSNGVKSANALSFDIGPKYLGGLPPIPGDSYSEAGREGNPLYSTDAYSEAGSEGGREGAFITQPDAGRENPYTRSMDASSEAGSEAGSESGGPIILP